MWLFKFDMNSEVIHSFNIFTYFHTATISVHFIDALCDRPSKVPHNHDMEVGFTNWYD